MAPREGRPSLVDLTDAQWQRVSPLLRVDRLGGRPRQTDLRQVINAIRHREATRCAWRNLPDAYPPWSTVRHYRRLWRQQGVWEAIKVILADLGD